MKLPSKVTSYKESVLSRFSPILNVLQKADTKVVPLFEATEKYFCNIEKFIDTLDCLFALHKIIYDAERGLIHYVA